MVNTAGDREDSSHQRADVVSGSTFDGVSYKIILEPYPCKYGSSAKILKGQILNVHETTVVAVKVFGGMLDPVKKELLIRELRFARKVSLGHPRILRFLGTATVAGQTAIVSLYMHNGDMMDYLRTHSGCDKKKLIVQVAEALEYLHGSVQLVHGDIKCSNVLISDTGDAVLSDFGLSTLAEKSQLETTTMAMIRKMNTLQFAAPELLIDEDGTPPSKTCASDVYAFGMLILEALSEKLPWPEQSHFPLMNRVLSREHPARPTIDGAFVTISHSWWNACLSCWSFEPRNRPLINDVLNALRAASPIPRLEFHFQEAIVTIACSPDGITLVGGSADGSVVLYNTATGQIRHLLRAASGYCYSDFDLKIAVSPNGQHIASASQAVINLWDTTSGVQITSMEHVRWVACMAYSPDGARIASGGTDGTVQLWDVETGDSSGDRLHGHASGVTCVAFAPNGRCVASGSYDGNIILHNSVTGSATGTLTHGENTDDREVFSICFLPGGRELVSGHRRTVIVWNLRTKRPAHIFDSHIEATWCVALSPSRKCIASGSPSGEICIWDVERGTQIGAPLVGHRELLRSLAFSPDGRTLVSASWGQKIRVWDLFV